MPRPTEELQSIEKLGPPFPNFPKCTGEYKNIYGRKYWEYMGRLITEILEKLLKIRITNNITRKNKKKTKTKYGKLWAVRLFID